jgi:hypothetical protein
VLNKFNNTCILDHLPSVLTDDQLMTVIELIGRNNFKTYLKTGYQFIHNLGVLRSLNCIYFYIDEDLLLTRIDNDITIIMMMSFEFKHRVEEMIDIMALDWDLVLNHKDHSGVCANDYLINKNNDTISH